jgi:urease accessory protein
VRVAIAQSAATLVDGDDVRLEVSVGQGCALELTEISATLAHPMQGGARWRLALSAAAGARVVLAEEPLIVAAGAKVHREVTIDAAADARIMHRETLVLGRHGEDGGAVTARTRVLRGGRPVLDDTLGFAGASSRSAAVLGSARVIASLALFGCELAGPADGLLLHSGDRLVRRLVGATTALADLAALVTVWRAAVLAGWSHDDPRHANL